MILKFNLMDVFEKTYSAASEFIKLETMTMSYRTYSKGRPMLLIHRVWGTGILSYRGEINVSLYNTSHKEFIVNIGDRISQMEVRLVPQIQFQQVTDLSETVRGEDGFGSTGITVD